MLFNFNDFFAKCREDGRRVWGVTKPKTKPIYADEKKVDLLYLICDNEGVKARYVIESLIIAFSKNYTSAKEAEKDGHKKN
jgi:hypothetical protein